MDRKHSSDQKANRRARERLKQAERGDLESAEELNQMDAADDGAAVSAEQEAADGPEGVASHDKTGVPASGWIGRDFPTAAQQSGSSSTRSA